MNEVHLFRGIPGVGKTTLARRMTNFVLAADDFFESPEGYKFNPMNIGEAHADCQMRFFCCCETKAKTIAVTNTFVKNWEIEFYLRVANSFGYSIFVHEFAAHSDTLRKCAKRNVHGVPLEVCERMIADFEQIDEKAYSFKFTKVTNHVVKV